MAEIDWERLPLVASLPAARAWLLQAAAAGLASTTIDAYSRAVERYLAHCRERRINPARATTEHIADYLRVLAAAGLRGATLHQRLTALRLFYAFVVERGGRADNPALALTGTTARPVFGPGSPPEEAAPWVPSDMEWASLLAAASAERQRTKLMLALAYDAALRREEVCGLRRADLDPDRLTLRVVSGHARTVPISPAVAARGAAYLRALGRIAGREAALFLSESPRNRAAPITIWTWSKVVIGIARRVGLPRFTTHTPRHLRLTDLARAGWSAAEIARFAGLSGAGPARVYPRLAAGMALPLDREAAGRRAEHLVDLLFAGSE
jgi:integrase/recombinase XerD